MSKYEIIGEFKEFLCEELYNNCFGCDYWHCGDGEEVDDWFEGACVANRERAEGEATEEFELKETEREEEKEDIKRRYQKDIKEAEDNKDLDEEEREKIIENLKKTMEFCIENIDENEFDESLEEITERITQNLNDASDSDAYEFKEKDTSPYYFCHNAGHQLGYAIEAKGNIDDIGGSAEFILLKGKVNFDYQGYKDFVKKTYFSNSKYIDYSHLWCPPFIYGLYEAVKTKFKEANIEFNLKNFQEYYKEFHSGAEAYPEDCFETEGVNLEYEEIFRYLYESEK